MNAIQKVSRRQLAAITLTATWALLQTPQAALATQTAAATAAPRSNGHLRVVSATGNTVDGKSENQTIEIHVDNGEVAAKVNGEEIPAARIRHENGSIVMTDADGNPIKSLQLNLQRDKRDGEAWVFSSAGRTGNLWRADEAAAGLTQPSQPKVMIGVHMSEPGEALERQLGLDAGKTTMISGLYQGLPAEAAGLAQYDIITKVDGKAPADSQSVRAALAGKNPGDEVTFTVVHGGQPKDVTLRLVAYDSKVMESATLIGSEPEDGAWAAGAPLRVDALRLHDAQDMQQLYRELLLAAPRINARPDLRTIAPKIQAEIREATAPGGAVDRYLEKLDKRLAEVEALLQKMVEQQSQTP